MGTYGGFGGPSEMFEELDKKYINANICKVDTGRQEYENDIEIAINITINSINQICENDKKPIILIGWSMGGHTVIKTIERMTQNNNPYLRRVKAIILISSRPEGTDFLQDMNNIRKYIICGKIDTERRTTGSINMFKIASQPKFYFEIENGTHNFERGNGKKELFELIQKIIREESFKFI